MDFMKKLEQLQPAMGNTSAVDAAGLDKTVGGGPQNGMVSSEAAADFIGFRGRTIRKSDVHVIEPGHAVHFEAGKAFRVDLTTNQRSEITGYAAATLTGAQQVNGYTAFASWKNNISGRTVTSFSTTWTVPPEPNQRQSQIIFLFNGMENDMGTLQPVLAWGPNPGVKGTGEFWCLSNWWAQYNGQFMATPAVRVNPGQEIVGIMRLTGQSGGNYSYKCEFQGAGNPLYMVNIPGGELNQLLEALEAYTLAGGAPLTDSQLFPATIRTRMRAIQVDTTRGLPAVQWTRHDVVTDSGQMTEIPDDSGLNGRVDLYYGSRLFKLRAGGELFQYIGKGGWQSLNGVPFPPHVPATAIASADGTPYLLDSQGSLMQYLSPPGFWQDLDKTLAATAVAAARDYVYQLHGFDGSIWRYPGVHTAWEMLDQNKANKQIFADGFALYKLQTDGSIWKYTGVPPANWAMMDNHSAKTIAVKGGYLYQLRKDGTIVRYIDWPTPTWDVLDNDATALSIAAGSEGRLYKLQANGSVWQRINGSWQELASPNGNTFRAKSIVADDDRLYKMDTDKSIWQLESDGWHRLDNDPQATLIIAG
jgi:hypothetical protein